MWELEGSAVIRLQIRSKEKRHETIVAETQEQALAQ